jgi:hypothetical protein
MQIQIPANDLKSALNTVLASALAAEQQLGQSAAAQLQALVDELYPLVVSETQALLTAANPAVPQAYLGILQGCVAAATAKLGLQALAEQRKTLASTLQTAIQILALLMKSAVAA